MLETLKEKWEDILEYMKEDHDITNVSYDTWLRPLVPYSIEDDKIYVSYPGEKHGLEYIQKKYTVFLQFAIEQITGVHGSVIFFLPDEEQPEKKKPSIDS